jgi:hypothetical protein
MCGFQCNIAGTVSDFPRFPVSDNAVSRDLTQNLGTGKIDCPRSRSEWGQHLLPDCARIRARQSDADWRLPLLVAEENEVGSAPHAKLAKDIGDVELHGAFGNI